MTSPKLLYAVPILGMVAILAITLSIACGPATPSGQQSDDPKSTPKPDGVKTPTPTVDPTKEKEIEDKLRTAVYRTPTPKPSGDGEDKATSTPEPEEPIPPTDVPTPTLDIQPAPTPTSNRYANITINADYCFNVDLQDPSLHRARDKYDAASYVQVECSQLVGRVIGERCYPNNGDPLDQKARECVKSNAEQVKDYLIRSSVYPECFADQVQSDSQFAECARQQGDNDHRLRSTASQTRQSIRVVVDSNQDVITAEQNAWSCLRETADNHPASQYVDTSRLLFWQNWVTDADDRRLSELGETRLEKVRQYMALVDQCALEANVYQTRYNALMAELQRYAAEEPEKIEPWLRFGTLDALKEYGAEALRP